jgi:hypothetical protein
MNDAPGDVEQTDEDSLTYEFSDEVLEDAADTARSVWTRVTTSCGGANC